MLRFHVAVPSFVGQVQAFAGNQPGVMFVLILDQSLVMLSFGRVAAAQNEEGS